MEEINGTSTPKVTRPDPLPNMEAIERFPQADRLVTKIGSTRKCLQRYEIYAPITRDEETTQARYGVSHEAVDEKGIRGFTTGPDYPGVGFDFDADPVVTQDPEKPDKPFIDYPIKPDGHNQMQVLMDGYKPGQKSEKGTAAAATKLKAQKYDSLRSGTDSMGLSEADFAEAADAPTEHERNIKLAALLARKAKELTRKVKSTT